MKAILTLPLPPSVNNYYGHHCKFRHASIYIKPKGKEYRKQVLAYILKNNYQFQANIPLSITIKINPSSKRKWDLDNRLKSLLDALTHAKVWEDDSLIYKLTVEKGEVVENGKVTILIERYNSF